MKWKTNKTKVKCIYSVEANGQTVNQTSEGIS